MQLELENLKLFDPVVQEYDQDEFLQQSTLKFKRNSVPKSTLLRYRGNSQSLGRALSSCSTGADRALTDGAGNESSRWESRTGALGANIYHEANEKNVLRTASGGTQLN
jgi:hypothetical protein